MLCEEFRHCESRRTIWSGHSQPFDRHSHLFKLSNSQFRFQQLLSLIFCTLTAHLGIWNQLLHLSLTRSRGLRLMLWKASLICPELFAFSRLNWVHMLGRPSSGCCLLKSKKRSLFQGSSASLFLCSPVAAHVPESIVIPLLPFEQRAVSAVSADCIRVKATETSLVDPGFVMHCG